MEEKLENIYAMMSKNGSDSEAIIEDSIEPSATTSSSRPDVQENTQMYPYDFDITTTFSPIIPLPEALNTHLYPDFSIPDLVFDNIQDVITKGIISFHDAENCLNSYQRMACNFPFVIIRPHTSLDSLRREKPFLLLAVLILGSRSLPKLQSTLDYELREMLSKKVIMNGEKSLDLLQGLLVYLNWYHLSFKLGGLQIYQVSQMAATMSVDLHTHQNREGAVDIKNLAVPIPTSNSPEDTDSFEFKRAFLGTYYLNSS